MEIILAVSVLLNIVFVPYSIKCARRLFVVGHNIADLQEQLASFQAHVDSLHQMEMYYGDESLQNLLNHTKNILKETEKYEDIYTIVLDSEEGDIEDLDETTEEEASPKN
tara:strand:+ start:289 stop:618 length:330 start_codon:yes stop_codon:yes gene_type:complete